MKTKLLIILIVLTVAAAVIASVFLQQGPGIRYMPGQGGENAAQNIGDRLTE